MKHGFIVFESDTHAGHREGLCPEKVEYIEDGELTEVYPERTATQKRLWNLREANIEKLPELLKRKPWIYCHMGDQTQGNKYIDSLHKIHDWEQVTLAEFNTIPIAQIKPAPKYMYFAKGTPSHANGMDRELEVRYNMRFPKMDIRTVWHELIDFGGFTIDAKHHGPPGGNRNWTKGNSAFHYLKSEMMDEFSMGSFPARLYARGHIHTQLRAGCEIKNRGQWNQSELITIPSMCGIGCFERQVVKNLKTVTNGWVIVEIRDGRIYEKHDWAQTVDIRTRKVIE